MSYQYDQYLAKHKENVRNGFEWLQTNLPELVKNIPNLGWQTGFAHDQSKSEPDEYEAYDAYFYGGNRSFKVIPKSLVAPSPPEPAPLATLGSHQRRSQRRRDSHRDANQLYF